MNTISDNKLPLTRIQKLIGKLMLQSKQQKPFCYLQSRANLTTLIKMRKPYCRNLGVRVTTNDFFFGAIAGAVKKFPLMAGRLNNQGRTIEISDKVGIGFAVTAPQGLVVPVIKDVIEKPLPRLAEESSILLKKARANKLTLDDFDGANIVFSSLGMYGVTSFFAVIPPNAAAIISTGTLNDAVVPVNADMMAQKTMSISLAVDNKIINDFYAAGFLQCLVQGIENPQTLTR